MAFRFLGNMIVGVLLSAVLAQPAAAAELSADVVLLCPNTPELPPGLPAHGYQPRMDLDPRMAFLLHPASFNATAPRWGIPVFPEPKAAHNAAPNEPSGLEHLFPVTAATREQLAANAGSRPPAGTLAIIDGVPIDTEQFERLAYTAYGPRALALYATMVTLERAADEAAIKIKVLDIAAEEDRLAQMKATPCELALLPGIEADNFRERPLERHMLARRNAALYALNGKQADPEQLLAAPAMQTLLVGAHVEICDPLLAAAYMPQPTGSCPSLTVPCPAGWFIHRTPADGDEGVAAIIGGVTLNRERFRTLCFDLYGRYFLKALMGLIVAQRACDFAGLKVDYDGTEAEGRRWVQVAYPEARPDQTPELLRSLLQRLSYPGLESQILLQQRAWVRRLAEGHVSATDAQVQEAWNVANGSQREFLDIIVPDFAAAAELRKANAHHELLTHITARGLPCTRRVSADAARTVRSDDFHLIKVVRQLQEGELSAAFPVGAGEGQPAPLHLVYLIRLTPATNKRMTWHDSVALRQRLTKAMEEDWANQHLLHLEGAAYVDLLDPVWRQRIATR